MVCASVVRCDFVVGGIADFIGKVGFWECIEKVYICGELKPRNYVKKGFFTGNGELCCNARC